jgi:glutamate 5-kinase
MKIVFKVEIETLFGEDRKVSPGKLEHLAMICASLQNSGARVMIVSSGAIALGTARLGFSSDPSGITAQQAAAAVGQVELIKEYQKFFDDFDQTLAQILLTKDVVDNPVRNINATNTLARLMDRGIIPLINENDSVSTNDIILNDNYPLVLIVTSLTGADMIVVNTCAENNYLLLFRNSSLIRGATGEELLDVSEDIKRGKLLIDQDIEGFPDFLHFREMTGANK